MLSAQQRVVLIPFERTKACQWRQRNRRLPDAESPAESEDCTRLTPVDLHRDKTQESLGAPIQILARRACRGVEKNWRKAKETERVSGLTERLEWIHLEVLPRARAIGRAHELHPPHCRLVSLTGVSDGSGADREIPCEPRFGKRLGIRIGLDRDVDPPRNPQMPEVQPHGRHPSLPPSIRQPLRLRLGSSLARPTKTLQEHLRDGSFRADRHARLLLGPLVDDPELAGLQATYRTAASTDEQRLVAIAFAQEARCTREESRARS